MAIRTRHCFRRLAPHALIALLLLTLAWRTPLLSSAQGADLQFSRSPQFGYLIWWDPVEWTVQDEQSDPGADWMQLGNGSSIVSFLGMATPGSTTASCLAERLADLEADPELVRFESLVSPGSRPEILERTTHASVSSTMILSFDTTDGPMTFAVRETCMAFDASGGILQISEWMAADAYNVNASAIPAPLDPFDSADVVQTLTMPRSAWPDGTSQQWPAIAFGPPTRLVSPDGEELAIFSAHTFACYDWPPPASPALTGTAIVIENTGVADLVIAPENFAAVDFAGNDLIQTSVQWLWPSLDSALPAVVPPGEIAIARLPDGNGDSFSFLDQWGNWLLLTTDIGCQGGGAAPVLIDLE